MPTARLITVGSSDAMESVEGNDSLYTLISQATGKEPIILGDKPIQWIQLLHALEQPDLPYWPMVTPVKVQMHKCEKCSQEFFSSINYRRHIRLHRRALNFDKESRKYRDLLGAFWNKLSLEEVKEVASLDDISLKEIPGTLLVKTLTESLQTSSSWMWSLPTVYMKAGATLMDIIEAKPSRLPISSQELFSVLDDASEGTFLCAGTADSMEKYLFDDEVIKVCLELRNLAACICFAFEQKLVKAWIADKEAEALRCQKLLVEEEEAAQRRQTELLEKKRQKKLRQKELKAKDQMSEEKTSLGGTADSSENQLVAEISSPPTLFDSDSNTLDVAEDVSGLQNGCEVMIGSISVSVKNCPIHTRCTNLAKTHDQSGCDLSLGSKTSVPSDDWVHVTRRGKGPKGRQDTEERASVEVGDQNLSCAMSVQPYAVENPDSKTHSHQLPFSSGTVKTFLTKRWNEVVSADHVKLVISAVPKSQGSPSTQSNVQKSAPPPSAPKKHSIVGENQRRR
nr:Serine/arginine repetitive matrix protein [Ipomoea batatas]